MAGKIFKASMFAPWRFLQFVPDWKMIRFWFFRKRSDNSDDNLTLALLDEFIRSTLGDRHAPFADLVIAGPAEDGAHSRRRPLERVFCRRIELCPRRPMIPGVKVVYLGKNSLRWRRRSIVSTVASPAAIAIIE
jgi:hypothetical protein